MARKTGLDHSNGQWIIFIDSDDAIHTQSIEILMTAAKKANNDLAVGGYKYFLNDSDINHDTIIEDPKTTHENNIDKVIHWLILDSPYPNIFMQTAWMKLYARNLLDKVDWNYCNYRANEDEFMAIQYYPKLKNGVVLVPEELYYYRVNNDSITRKEFKNEFEGKLLNKFETINIIYEKRIAKLGRRFEKDILIRFTVEFLGFIEQYAHEGRLRDDIADDYIKYFEPKMEKISKIKDKLSSWPAELVQAAQKSGLYGIMAAIVERQQRHIKHLERVIQEDNNVIESLNKRVKYMSSIQGMVRTPLGKVKRLSFRILNRIRLFLSNNS